MAESGARVFLPVISMMEWIELLEKVYTRRTEHGERSVSALGNVVALFFLTDLGSW
jgi:hypothetical protein